MSNSPLITHTNLSPNRTAPRNHAIDTITIHCAVGQLSIENLLGLKRFQTYHPSTGASCNYAIGYDGRIGLGVDEANRSWCSTSPSNDHRAITIEVASDTTHPYAVTSKALNALINLCTDICKRNGIKRLLWKADKSLIGQVSKQNMTVHRWFANKACPGDYLYNLHGTIADEVNRRLIDCEDTSPSPSQPAPNIKQEDDTMTPDQFAAMMKEWEAKNNPTYDTLADIPDYWKPEAKALIDHGILQGVSDTKLGIKHETLKAAVLAWRAASTLDCPCHEGEA